MSPESRWMHEHREELKPYLWKWIAVLGERVIASGDTPVDVMNQLQVEGARRPLLKQVWPDDVDPDAYFIG